MFRMPPIVERRGEDAHDGPQGFRVSRSRDARGDYSFLAGTTSTGLDEARSTCSATLPIKVRRIPERP